ncbi:MAG: polysaccharide biosynthesis tyrosine autokinase [Acidobacteriaceae bacterium]|nr:polysaccharide biosynthesis tyrosine autokinase [Acidobacteriaceae bacterium]
MKEIELPDLPELNDKRRMPQYVATVHPEFVLPEPAVPAIHYLWVIVRQRWKILGFVGISMLATFLYSSRLPRIYEATTTIDVDRRLPSGVIGQESSQVAAAEDSDQFLSTQAELIQSDAVLRPVVKQFNLFEREAEAEHLSVEKALKLTSAPVFLKSLHVRRAPNAYILKINYRSADPQLAADVANAVADSYLRHTFEIRISSAAALSAFMEKQLDGLKANMERSGMALAKFEQELNIINPEERTSIVSARLLQLNTEYTNAQTDRVRKEAALKAMQTGTLAAAQVSSQSDELSRLNDRLNQAQQHFATVSTIFGPNHSEYRKAANEVAEVQRQLEDARDDVVQRVETEYQEALAREQMLKKGVGETKAEFDELNSRSYEYQRLKRDAEADKALYSDLERRIKEAGINAGFQNSSVRIADLARPPQLPILPRTGLNLLLALVISSVLSVCAAVLADELDTTLRDPEQAAHALRAVVIGGLPSVRASERLSDPVSRGRTRGAQRGSDEGSETAILPCATYQRSSIQGSLKNRGKQGQSNRDGVVYYEEAIRSLRHSILLPDFERSIRSLLVTSAMPGEGKSTAIIHLGIAHSEQAKRTLIIDADLRRPSIHKRLHLDGVTGLSNVLLGEAAWKDVVVQSAWPELKVLPAGMASRRASDLVGSMMIDILDEAAKQYDLVLVDAPPLLGFAEAMQIATAVDGVVVMAQAGQTSRKAVATVLAMLKRLRVSFIGLVLNEVDRKTSNDYYDYGKYHEYYTAASTPQQG